MDVLIETVRPIDGTQDAEAGREAIRDSLAELLEKFPDANLLDLSEAQRLFAIERFVATDVFNRVILDIGKSIQDKAPTASVALSRMKDMKEYIRESVSSRFRELHQTFENPTANNITDVVKQSITECFEVFEDYVS